MKKLSLIIAPIAFLVGCGNACDKAGDRMTAKLEECGIDTSSSGDGGEDVECTDELATQSECYADCTEAADCAALDGSDMDALMSYSECLAGCV